MRDWAATLPDPAAVLRGQAAMHLTNRLATPEEIAAAIAYLSGTGTASISGISLDVNAGRSSQVTA